MPVTLNEPLSALQRLCEELEYSELLDKAASSEMSDLDRMTWVAAFAVSVYGSCQVAADGWVHPTRFLGQLCIHISDKAHFLRCIP